MNKPSPPDSFVALYRIDMSINFDDWLDDRRRVIGELWCSDHAKRRWFRRVLARFGRVEFHFEDQNDAAMFWLAN